MDDDIFATLPYGIYLVGDDGRIDPCPDREKARRAARNCSVDGIGCRIVSVEERYDVVESADGEPDRPPRPRARFDSSLSCGVRGGGGDSRDSRDSSDAEDSGIVPGGFGNSGSCGNSGGSSSGGWGACAPATLFPPLGRPVRVGPSAYKQS